MLDGTSRGGQRYDDVPLVNVDAGCGRAATFVKIHGLLLSKTRYLNSGKLLRRADW